jgi:short-subunit dehydrogenase
MLTSTSKSPSVLLVSSLASLIPAPTRSIYASTKSASLLLYQSLAIEHRSVAFSLIIPATVEGDFRASAVDSGPVVERDPNKYGLKREIVAERCVQAVDHGDKTVFMPSSMRLGHLLYWLAPGFVEWRASVKYGFQV